MNDAKLYEISESTGYMLPLMLSISAHILLAGSFWLGANIQKSPGMKGATIEHGMTHTSLPTVVPRVQDAAVATSTVNSASISPRVNAVKSATRSAVAQQSKSRNVRVAEAPENRLTTKRSVATESRNKIKPASNKRIAKIEANRSVKKGLPKSPRKEVDVAESKKLKTMREAELRRIKNSVS